MYSSKKVKFNLQNETKYNSFLLENSSKTFLRKKIRYY